jgi:hypothetical protein
MLYEPYATSASTHDRTLALPRPGITHTISGMRVSPGARQAAHNYARLADAQGFGEGRAEAVAGSGNLRGLSGWRATRWGPSCSIGPGHHLAAIMVILRRFLGSCPGSCDHAELGQHARHPCPCGPYGQQERTPTR